MSSSSTRLPSDVAAAYRDARARGLPEGWTCSIDKRNRRKWTAPNGRSCDSIPKALAISVELGLLPPDTKIQPGKRKRTDYNASKKATVAAASVDVSPGENDKRPWKRGTKESTTTNTNVRSTTLSSSTCAENDAVSDSNKLESEIENAASTKVVTTKKPNVDNEDDDSSELDYERILSEPPPEPMDPETSLDVHRNDAPVLSTGTSAPTRRTAMPTTVHWDPHSPDGAKVGWRVRIILGPSSSQTWMDGRIVRYDPYTHKHKLVYERVGGGGRKKTAWIWLRSVEHNLLVATRLVWAHVKGYAWWPALVIESNCQDLEKRKEGYVQVEFFGTEDVSTLRDTPDCIRPFSFNSIDPVVSKHKKKRNARAFQLACNELENIRNIRNEAAIFYAKKALDMAQLAGKQLVSKRVSLHRLDINYPYGENLTAKVRSYSFAQKKWLLSFDISSKSKVKYEACWIDVFGKRDCSSLTLLEKKEKEYSSEDLVPYLVGFEPDKIGDSVGNEWSISSQHNDLAELLSERCRGCVEHWKKQDVRAACDRCGHEYHLSCLDPALSLEAWQRIVKEGSDYICSKCTPCDGCYQHDIVFGSNPFPKPPTLSFPKNNHLNLCSMCMKSYEKGCFCPNCAHTWDVKKLNKVTSQIEYSFAVRKKRGGNKDCSIISDTALPLVLGSFSGDEGLAVGAKIDPTFYYPESSEWGYGENEMLVCDECDLWVHAGCAGLDETEYEKVSDGEHPIYSKEFLCRVCCRQRCKDIILALQNLDSANLFATPVTEKVAPNYRDVIKEPMDLQTMLEKTEADEYQNYAWVRHLFELMVLNALLFNKYNTDVWIETQRYYKNCLETVFSKLGKAAPPGIFKKDIDNCFRKGAEAQKMEEDRVQVDDTVEKKDLVAGSTMAVSVTLPPLRNSPLDLASCLPFSEVKLKSVDSFYCCWMECCYTCGSSGAMDTMLFCVDCGEAFHTFCVNAPIHSMDDFAVSGWRCPNCKICEISGDVPQEETQMLFCEMCDRAFCLNLLDPPLESAPSGLWVCGQCVECEKCNNTAERKGASLTHWSRNPQKCYRCGGCDGLVQVEHYTAGMQCGACEMLLRKEDTDFVRCSKCETAIHTFCDTLAMESANCYAQQSRYAQQDKYFCPSCRPAEVELHSNQYIGWNWLEEKAWTLINDGSIGPHDNFSDTELFSKLIDDIDREVRYLWKDEYIDIVQAGLRVYILAQGSFDDARIIVQHALSGVGSVPIWLIQRALRFVFLVRRSKWITADLDAAQIESLLIGAKLAAAFVNVYCSVLNLDIESVDLEASKLIARFEMFFQESNACGTFSLDHDRIRTCTSSGVNSPMEKTKVTKRNENAVIPSPLCGWKSEVISPEFVWMDPRECCLCHLCGDDDAGFECRQFDDPNTVNEPSHLGRLLPMSDGMFVHTGCALWSSEAWEDPNNGLIYAVDKARCRGSQLKCFGCGRHGATVGCNKGSCIYNYHFPCAKKCGSVFTAAQQVYCEIHKTTATNILVREHFEHMKPLMIAPEKKAIDDKDAAHIDEDLCTRVGTLVVHSFGKIESSVDGFHSENYITPPGYVATRIFWSTVLPRTRTLYILKVERSDCNGALFTILPSDNPSGKLIGASVYQVYSALLEKVRKTNTQTFSHGDLCSKLPVVRKTRKKAFGLNGPQFFGFGLNHIRKYLEYMPGVEAVVAPLTSSSPKYRFCYAQPQIESVKDLQRKRAAVKAEQSLENSSGCARTEGIKAVARSGGSGRITRALVRSAEEEPADQCGTATTKKGEEKAKTDRTLSQQKYRLMKSVPIDQRLAARRSHIHGWGLFTKLDIPKDDPIVEYMGETIRQPIADKREKAYEISGEGSCYMFRLDRHRIVDATMIGCMARFMNHSCDPNAYAKIISVDTESGQEKKIVIFANRAITVGEEITYDYKFPVEDGSLRCTCGAPNCIGRMN